MFSYHYLIEILRKINPEIKLKRINKIHQKHDAALYRIVTDDNNFVIKVFNSTMNAKEVRCYSLLQENSVPTLPVYGKTENAIMLEDLESSTYWRLATKSDINNKETGRAVAKWYLKLHSAGKKILNSGNCPDFLEREIDSLNPEILYKTGERFNLNDLQCWKLSIDNIEKLKTSMKNLPETLNYNDFFWTNLALSRPKGSNEAIIFDYHLMGIGLRYSDCRNATYSLGKKAKDAFWEVYGKVDEKEKILDKPVSLIYSLTVATKRPNSPQWVKPLIKKIYNKEFGKSLRLALEIIS